MKSMFYFFLALTAVFSATINALRPVLDINGEIVFGGSYYVLPAIRGQGGGVSLAGRGGNHCPLEIVQASSELNQGIPVEFSGYRSKLPFVPESENLNILSAIGPNICVQSTYWWVDEYYQVAPGPTPQGTGKDLMNSFFQIKITRVPDAYRIVFCPRGCIDVGIFVDEKGVRRLALSDEPFLVQFKKANVTVDSSKTIFM